MPTPPRLSFLFLVLLVTLNCSQAASKVYGIKTESGNIKVETIATGLGIPWGMAFLSEKEMLVSERAGRLHRVNIETGIAQEISGVPEIYASGQGGLLDLALDPKFAENALVYFTYSIAVDGGSTQRLSRGKLKGNKLESIETLFTAQPASSKKVHFGSRMAFDDKGHIFFSVGDRGLRDRAQDLGTHSGKIMRIKLDGSVPKDNPFVNDKKALPEIWSYGHRNPQGLTFRGDTGELWSHEHGPRGGDEINVIQAKKNYGWPVITYGKEYWGPSIGTTKKEGMVQPLKYYVPSIAPSGMTFYSGKKIPEWKGNLFIGALALTHINRNVIKDGKVVHEERLMSEWKQRIRNIQEGPDGYLYFGTDAGKIMRFSK